MRPQHRPLSPFWIYRFGWTMSLSGSHRLTGMALSVGAPLFVLWLFAVAGGSGAYADYNAAMLSPFGLLVFGGFIFSIVFHLCNGLRHLAWDFGLGIDVVTARRSGISMVVVVALITAAVLWSALKGLL